MAIFPPSNIHEIILYVNKKVIINIRKNEKVWFQVPEQKSNVGKYLSSFFYAVIIAVELHHFPRAHNGKFFQNLNNFNLCDGQVIKIDVIYGYRFISQVHRKTLVAIIPKYYHRSTISSLHSQNLFFYYVLHVSHLVPKVV